MVPSLSLTRQPLEYKQGVRSCGELELGSGGQPAKPNCQVRLPLPFFSTAGISAQDMNETEFLEKLCSVIF